MVCCHSIESKTKKGSEMKEKELRARSICAICNKAIGAGGSPLFYTLRIERHWVNLAAVQRQTGLALVLGGSSALAAAMGPDEEMTEPAMKPLDVTICERCANTEQVLIPQFVEDQGKAAPEPILPRRADSFQIMEESAAITPGEALVKVADERDRLKKELQETQHAHTMQLAAISTAACCNTRETAADQRIKKGNPYWTVAYEDVIAAIEREMDLREQVQKRT